MILTYNDYILVRAEEKDKIKTISNKAYKEVIIETPTKEFKKGDTILINNLSPIHYKDNLYFIQEKHIIAKITETP